MVFNSVQYLIFFPIVLLMYYLFTAEYRYIWLLFSSYLFYSCWNVKYVFLLLAITIITYFTGLLLDYIKEKKTLIKYRKICVAICILLELATLFFYKYFNFLLENVQFIFSKLNIDNNINKFDIIMPVGISFFIFQSLGYVIDVYREEVKAEKNFCKYALFVSFFPTLLSGPIERSKNLLKQLNEAIVFDVEKIRRGLVTFTWGLFLKLVIADRINKMIQPVYQNYAEYGGMILIIVTVMYAIQIYTDFEGYSQMAMGSALILGLNLKKNFDSPYFALSVQEFWRRWHISLTSWFRDYLYIPLGGNRKGKCMHHINTMIVFLISGLWHGAGWNYIIWGGLNGAFIVIQNMTKKLRNNIYDRCRIKKDDVIFRWLCRIITFIVIDFTWLFFATENIADALVILKMMIRDLDIVYLITNSWWNRFTDIQEFIILFLAVLMAAYVDYMNYKKVNIIDKVLKQKSYIRWFIYIAFIMIILVWGAYGEEYVQTQFIYFQF